MHALRKAIPPVAAVLGWFAIVFQFFLAKETAHVRDLALGEIVIRFFSYFTILTNILVAVFFSYHTLTPVHKADSFWKKPSVAMSLTAYILVVGIIYNVILRELWSPQAWAKIVDELLHTFIPIVTMIYWLTMPKGELKWKDCLPLLLYPLVYSVYVMIRGSFADFYPYPFLDVTQVGYPAVFVNMAAVFAVFIVLGLALIFIDRKLRKSHS